MSDKQDESHRDLVARNRVYLGDIRECLNKVLQVEHERSCHHRTSGSTFHYFFFCFRLHYVLAVKSGDALGWMVGIAGVLEKYHGSTTTNLSTSK